MQLDRDRPERRPPLAKHQEAQNFMSDNSKIEWTDAQKGANVLYGKQNRRHENCSKAHRRDVGSLCRQGGIRRKVVYTLQIVASDRCVWSGRNSVGWLDRSVHFRAKCSGARSLQTEAAPAGRTALCADQGGRQETGAGARQLSCAGRSYAKSQHYALRGLRTHRTGGAS